MVLILFLALNQQIQYFQCSGEKIVTEIVWVGFETSWGLIFKLSGCFEDEVQPCYHQLEKKILATKSFIKVLTVSMKLTL